MTVEERDTNTPHGVERLKEKVGTSRGIWEDTTESG